jgi:hypothetical protein
MTKAYLLAGCALVLVACGNTGNGSGDGGDFAPKE